MGEQQAGVWTSRPDIHKEGLPRMPRVDAVWAHPLVQGAQRRLRELERDRVFCHHQARHLLDTARIMWIVNLEQGFGFERELVYVTGLLHDVGKPAQYEDGTPHEVEGARLAAEILADLPTELAFTAAERDQIITAIRGHRRLREGAEPLERLLYQADKASRACFACPPEVREACTWSDGKKNLDIRI